MSCLRESEPDEELVVGGLMIIKHQIRSFFLLLEFYYLRSVFDTRIRAESKIQNVANHRMSEFYPLFALAFCFLSVSRHLFRLLYK